MKKVKRLSVILFALFFLASCGPINEKYFNVKYLFGEWKEGTVHDKYFEDGTGYTWDTSDDVEEDEALPFKWTLSQDTLLLNHVLWNGAIVPKIYLVTTLDSLNLVYEDLAGGTIHQYHKVSVP